MVGILLLTHAPLGQAFIEAATHVFRGRPERVEAVDVVADQDPLEINRLAQDAIARLDDGSGVLVITDVMGGTPSNCCNQLGDPAEVDLPGGAGQEQRAEHGGGPPEHDSVREVRDWNGHDAQECVR